MLVQLSDTWSHAKQGNWSQHHCHSILLYNAIAVAISTHNYEAQGTNGHKHSNMTQNIILQENVHCWWMLKMNEKAAKPEIHNSPSLTDTCICARVPSSIYLTITTSNFECSKLKMFNFYSWLLLHFSLHPNKSKFKSKWTWAWRKICDDKFV